LAIVGLGVDLVRIARFDAFVTRGKMAVIQRIFSDKEQSYCLTQAQPGQHFAVRFAAKEAFLKALGTGLRDGISWQEMVVERDELGCPSLQVTGHAARVLAKKGGRSIYLSYSHDGDYGVATVVLEV